jgi:hypothetical protein
METGRKPVSGEVSAKIENLFGPFLPPPELSVTQRGTS